MAAQARSPRMPHASSGGIAIDYDDVGQGPALLLMPGWCASRRAFDALTPLLARRHRVLSMDWRGHGGSGPAQGDFGFPQLVEDARAVIDHARAASVVPVATAHAGWVAIELRRQMGAARIPAIVLIDWIVTPAPPPFIEGLRAIQDPARWEKAREGLFGMWLEGVTDAEVKGFVRREMAAFGFDMWARGCREIEAAYAREGSPLQALGRMSPPPRTLHAYAQPADPGYLKAQQEFAAKNPWFRVRHLAAKSHFPTIEAPGDAAREVEAFLT